MHPWWLLALPAHTYGTGVEKAEVLASACAKRNPKPRAGLVTPGPLATQLTSVSGLCWASSLFPLQ